MRTVMVLAAALILSSTAYVTRGVASPVQSGPSATAQEPHDHQHAPTSQPEVTQPDNGGRRQMTMKGNAVDDLSQLVARMNAATGEAKTAAIADLLSRLVEQQDAMRTAMAESKKAMTSCSMMKDSATAGPQPEK
jgi:hypothetical protein